MSYHSARPIAGQWWTSWVDIRATTTSPSNDVADSLARYRVDLLDYGRR
jgi:hypothetical protein